MQPLHYGLSILAALFGVVVAGRQVLLHIVPGSGAYGSALFGLHLYTWSLILFGAVIAGVALLMIVGGRPDHDRSDHQAAMRFRGIHRFAAWFLVVVTLANALNSLALCARWNAPTIPRATGSRSTCRIGYSGRTIGGRAWCPILAVHRAGPCWPVRPSP